MMLVMLMLLLANQRVGQRGANDDKVERSLFGGGNRLQMVHRLCGMSIMSQMGEKDI